MQWKWTTMNSLGLVFFALWARYPSTSMISLCHDSSSCTSIEDVIINESSAIPTHQNGSAQKYSRVPEYPEGATVDELRAIP
jgi:hypothetical protein